MPRIQDVLNLFLKDSKMPALSKVDHIPHIRISRYFVLSVGCSLSYPILFAMIYEATVGTIVCSLTHAFCSAVVMYRVVFRLLLKRSSNVSMAAMFILISLLYFSASSVKYFEAELYPGFIDNNALRLIYSLLALIVLRISFEIIVRMKTRYRYANFTVHNDPFLRVTIIIILFFICLNIVDSYQKGVGYRYHLHLDILQVAMERTSSPTIEKIRMWLVGCTNVVLVLLLSLHFRKKGSKKLIVMALSAVFIMSLFSGGRSAIFFFFLGLAFSLVYLYEFGKKNLARIFLAAPIIICIGSVLILSVAGRIGFGNSEQIKHQLAYRFDLTDYAATLIQANNPIAYNYQIVSDAVYYSIPKIFYPGKYDANRKIVLEQLSNANMDERTDYTDTFFSIGAQLGGIIGFVFIPFLMILFLYTLEQFFYRIFGLSSHFIIIAMYPLYLTVETDLNSLFAAWRMVPAHILFGLVLYWLFTKRFSIFRIERAKKELAVAPAK